MIVKGLGEKNVSLKIKKCENIPILYNIVWIGQ
jgi:hypothetical protein